MPRVQRVNRENRQRRRLVRDLMRIRRNEEERRPGLTNRNPEFHCLGPMDQICRNCNALYFRSEKRTRGEYTQCCHGGKVDLPPIRSHPVLEEMSTGDSQKAKHFKKHCRNYNQALAMVSSSANIKPNQGGPYFFIVNGQVHHRIGINIDANQESSSYAQIYFYDTEQAVRMRCDAPQNNSCNENVMLELTNLINEVNPYAHAFKTMGQVLRETPGDQQQNVKMVLYSDRNRDQRRYNLPTANDVAAVFKSDDGCPEGAPEFIVYPKNGYPENLGAHCSGLDPMAYPLLFPFGEEGWFREMPQVEHRATLRRNTVTQLQFASHRLSVRQDYSPVIHGGKLSLQYIVDMFTRIEGDRLAFIRREQSKLRAELYMNLHDAIRARAENEGLNVGRQVILPKSFQGSYRNLHSNYLDAMAIVRQQGKPDLFITFTCNSNWEEIKSNLKYNEPANMRPDLVVRVFHEKLKDLMKEITDNKIFGTVIANIYTIEFQKRGLPHAHILITLDRDSKLRDSDDIDKLVWAEIPDPVLYPDLHEIVARNMIHGPCGTTNPNAPCMIEGKCSKSFPKQFLDQTRENVNGYPIYRRRDDGKTLIVRGSTVDNRFVVPYNPYLLKKFNAHINVEICSTVKSVKYIYKYIYKGFDSASIEFRNGDTIIYDEVQGYLNARWVGSAEAMWRIQEYPMHHQSHTVVNLECHLEDQQRVIFVQGNEEQALEPRNTKLMAWFRLNETDESAREYTYCEIPKHYTWQDNGKFWRKRQRGHDRIIARLNVVSAKNVELFHIRLLLLHVKGARCFNDIRTVDGHVYETYRDAAIARGIAESSQLSRDTLQEAVYYASPNDLRNLFGCLLGLNVPTESLDLWNEFKAYMIEDFTNRGSSEEEALNGALSQIEEILRTHNTSCRDLGLPTPVIRLNQVVNQANSEMKRVEFDSLYSKANEDQKKIIDSIIEKVQSRDRCHSLFYLDAPAGCGKTYIQKTLLAKLGSMEMVAIPVAFTGIAASLIEGGRTLHNQFKLPIPILENSVSGVTPNSPHGRYLNSAKLIIIDEISMTPSNAITVIDRLFRDLSSDPNLKQLPFAGKVVLFSGDFRQTLPVVPHAGRTVIVENCLKNNPLWPCIKKVKLTKNMRVNDGEDVFANFLLEVGNNSLPRTSDGFPILPERLLGIGSPIDFIYPDVENCIRTGEIKNRAILAPKNSDCDIINNNVLSTIQGETKVYGSVDTLLADNMDAQLECPTEFLNSVEISGLPRHHLCLKIGAVVLLIRNLNTAKGLINGTRLQVARLHENTVECKVLTGTSEGEQIFIPRIKMCPSETILPFKMQRLQFPLLLAFAMTINKAQGQSLTKSAIYLPKPVFTHGQLYVALSRSRSFNGTKIFINETGNQRVLPDGGFSTSNVVFEEVLID